MHSGEASGEFMELRFTVELGRNQITHNVTVDWSELSAVIHSSRWLTT